MRRFVAVLIGLILLGCSPKFDRWTPDQGIAALQASGLECTSPRAMTAQDYGLAPMGKTGIRFLIPSLGGDAGGRLIAFEDKAQLDKARTYYVELGKGSAAFFSWVYVRDNLLLQINGKLPEAQAKAYEAALQAMK